MQVADAVAQAADEGGRVLPGELGPEHVELQVDVGGEAVDEVVERRAPVDVGPLVRVVVVADADPLACRDVAQRVEAVGEPGDRVDVGQRVRAEPGDARRRRGDRGRRAQRVQLRDERACGRRLGERDVRRRDSHPRAHGTAPQRPGTHDPLGAREPRVAEAERLDRRHAGGCDLVEQPVEIVQVSAQGPQLQPDVWHVVLLASARVAAAVR